MRTCLFEARSQCKFIQEDNSNWLKPPNKYIFGQVHLNWAVWTFMAIFAKSVAQPFTCLKTYEGFTFSPIWHLIAFPKLFSLNFSKCDVPVMNWCKIIGWEKTHLVAFIADNIVDEESGKILAIYNVNHLEQNQIATNPKIVVGEKTLTISPSSTVSRMCWCWSFLCRNVRPVTWGQHASDQQPASKVLVFFARFLDAFFTTWKTQLSLSRK